MTTEIKTVVHEKCEKPALVVVEFDNDDYYASQIQLTWKQDKFNKFCHCLLSHEEKLNILRLGILSAIGVDIKHSSFDLMR